MKQLILFIIAYLSLIINANAENIQITVKGIKTTKGILWLGVYKNDKDFRANKAVKKFRYTKSDIRDGILNINIELEPGIYGLSVLDDENSNQKMDYNLIGIPKEGYGFSNFYHTGFTRPVFDDFKFEANSRTKPIEIKMRYL